ncbi:30S ribosomal protein S4 [Syntrophorhabdus aromaticivorans]|uniref:Small ribosomal subunit protein uS4 n=1 Tax=Syntrophorhabdus aromaticivorans TaxID=328301 RepID=A0A351U437_9BACT|nr:30S ribosomal protein S4 [Syntrophorhabdus aromaticivorans]NLW34268.1 30S ribosomal protein S4 [Syntrophorhabdus aromaticivorans]HBA54718.1 30S ribosomal protein S4 [Syntrophorhabdus aromaticivorans]
MSRYVGPSCRLCRREAIKLFLKGERCYTEKCAVEKRNYPPGVHVEVRGKFLEYGLRLREKQRVRKIYGLSEKQFKRFFTMAEKKQGITGTNFLILLERRLDNMVFRLGFATSRKEARQIVSHNHIAVNGRKVNAPSYIVKEGDEIAVRHKDLESVKNALESVVRRGIPSWIELDKEDMKGVVKLLPSREDITMPIREQLIVEYYSR